MSTSADPAQRQERFPFSCHICGRRSVVMRGRGPGEVPADLGRCSLCGRWACPDHYSGLFQAGRPGFICDACTQAKQVQAARRPRLGCRSRVLGAGALLGALCLARAMLWRA